MQVSQGWVFLIYPSTLTSFSNVSIHPVASPLGVYKFFGSVNDFNSHKKSSRSDLVLEKFWVNQCSWLKLFITVAMRITITDFWKIFHYSVKKYHHEKLIVIR